MLALPLWAFVVASGAPNSVAGGGESELSWTRDVAFAWSGAGRVFVWEGAAVRWRAPAVCAPVRLTVRVQAEDGAEEGLAVDVVPGDTRAPLVLLPPIDAQSGDAPWDLQGAAVASVAFVASAGRIEPGEDASVDPAISDSTSGAPIRCTRARWRPPPAVRPDYAVVAAFAGERLLAFEVVQRPAWTSAEVDRTRPGSVVQVLVAGRRFVATADASGRADVPIEVPPNVAEVTALRGRRTARVVLRPPPPTRDHAFVAPDGARWLVRIDASGTPTDGELPAGAARMAVGVFRWQSEVRVDRAAATPNDAPKADPAAREPGAASAQAQEAVSLDGTSVTAAAGVARTTARAAPARSTERIEATAAVVTAPRARSDFPSHRRWRIALGATLGPAGLPGSSLALSRAIPWRGSLGATLSALVFPGRSSHAVDAASANSVRSILGGALVVEGVWHHALGAWTLTGSLGGGAGTALRRVATRGLSPVDRRSDGWVGTAACSLTHDRYGLEARALYSPAHLGVESAPWLGSISGLFFWGGP